MKPKPTVGQKLFSLNHRYRRKDENLTPAIVTSIGRKYFLCEIGGAKDVQFRLENWKQVTEYQATHLLYETEQEWLDEKERSVINTEIKAAFSHYGGPKYSLDALRRIKAIINETP